MLDLLDPTLLLGLVDLSDKPTPDADDVVAGWTGLFIILAMGAALALLGWSLSRHLRKTRENRDAGVYGDEPASPEPPRDDLP